jgi:hypothetical protein
MTLIKNLTIFAVMNLGAFAQQTPGLSAHWEGALQVPEKEKEVHLSLDLAKNAKGEWIGSVSLPNAHIQDAPVVGLSVQDGGVRFELGVAHASFEGKLSADGSVLAGTASSDEGGAPFQLKRAGSANVKVPAASTELSKSFEGAWEGTLDVSGQKLRALLKLARAADGTATGTLISVDQGGQEFPITTITQKDKQLLFELTMIRAKYTGAMNDTGEIAGEYSVDGLNLPLVFKRTAETKKQ